MQTQKKGDEMVEYKSAVSGYIYDPEEDDSVSGVAPSPSFKELLEDWIRPICGMSKDQFEKME